MRIAKNKKGQFIMIAVMMIALMIISVGAIIYGARTYYKYEQWEEYTLLVDQVKLSTIRLMEISLANYTAFGKNSTLKDNLDQWQNDLGKAYPGYGVILTYDLSNSSHPAYGMNISYFQGLTSHWNETVSCSAANATFTVNIASVGLEGYEFMATTFLSLTILNTTSNEINVAVIGKDEMPITDLKKENFQVNGLGIDSVTSSYDSNYIIVYTITCDGPIPAPVTVIVWDQRGIKVIAEKA